MNWQKLLIKIIRILLFPIVPVYYLITRVRNYLYDCGILKTTVFSTPVIAVGNLSTGGTGKSPMIEYLLSFLSPSYKIAVLSRGYGRKSKGFRLVEKDDLAINVGDEPLQFKTKFQDVEVAVDEKRARGIKTLLMAKNPELILLDDAFQHRKVKAGYYILLTTYQNLYVNDIVLPTGNLREPKCGAKRASAVVITKCPFNLSVLKSQEIADKLNLTSSQNLYFTSIDYENVIKNEKEERSLKSFGEESFLLVTGIANPKPLVRFLKNKDLSFDHLDYADHYNFNEKDIAKFKSYPLILCTEKDYVRLCSHFSSDQLWYQPIRTKFLFNAAHDFESKINDYILKSTKV